jgi:hypothetical protein
MVPHDDVGYVPPPAHEDADLAVDEPRDLGEVPREFVGDDAGGGDPPPGEALDLSDLSRLEAGQVSVNPLYFLCSFVIRCLNYTLLGPTVNKKSPGEESPGLSRSKRDPT